MTKLESLIKKYINSQKDWANTDFHEKVKDEVNFTVSFSTELIQDNNYFDELSEIFNLKQKDIKKIERAINNYSDVIFTKYEFFVEEIEFIFFELSIEGEDSFSYNSLNIEDSDIVIIEDFFS